MENLRHRGSRKKLSQRVKVTGSSPVLITLGIIIKSVLCFSAQQGAYRISKVSSWQRNLCPTSCHLGGRPRPSFLRGTSFQP